MDSSRLAKLIALPTPFLISGYMIASSQNFLPSIIDQPSSISTIVFAKIYQSGVAILVPTMTIGSAAFGYLAYDSSNRTKRNMYSTAGALTIGMAIFTRVFMAGGIDRLIDISKDSAAQAEAQSSGEALRLLKTWVMQNWLRSGMGFAAGMLGLVTVLDA